MSSNDGFQGWHRDFALGQKITTTIVVNVGNVEDDTKHDHDPVGISIRKGKELEPIPRCQYCKNGNNRFILTDKQESRGRNVGRSIHQNCYICCKYLTPMGETEYIQTTFQCSSCKMPLCKKDRSNPDIGRKQSCVDEHITSKCENVGCHGNDRHYTNFPRELQVQLVSNRITRNRNISRSRRGSS